MTATSFDGAPPRRAGKAFPPFSRWDRNFFLLYAGLIWLGIAMGFGGDVARHIQSHERPYPLIVHFHAAAFMGWLALFTVQIVLIRTKRLELHRNLGFAMAGLAGVMVVLGPVTALIADHAKIGTPAADPAFLSVQFGDMGAFAGFVAAAVAFRRTPSTHKRLILLSTVCICDAGYARWLGDGLTQAFGTSPFGFWVSLFIAPTLLILGIGAYDLATRQRLHPAYLVGLGWAALWQALSVGLYFSPAWKAFAAGLIQRAG